MWRIEWYDENDDHLIGEHDPVDDLVHELVDVLDMTLDEAAEGGMIPLSTPETHVVLVRHGVAIPDHAEPFLTLLAE